MIVYTCKICGKEFGDYKRNRKYCSWNCYWSISPKTKRKCLICNKVFIVHPCKIKIGKGLYCSRKCKGKGSIGIKLRKTNYFKKCLTCDKKFRVYKCQLKLRKYCSHKCRPSPCKKTKRKMSEAQKRNPTRYWLGKKRLDMSGENNWNWKNGITPENQKIRYSIETKVWRRMVFTRDNWTCQRCKEKGIHLHPHHIRNFSTYPKLRFIIDNGITFCFSCHMEFHNRYGRKNNTRKQLEDFLSVNNYYY